MTDEQSRIPANFKSWIVERTRREDECWIYIGPVTEGGYGTVWWWDSDRGANRMGTAHRVMWEIENGTIPNGMVIDHLCHDPSTCSPGPCRHRACCNPDHLAMVTQRENTMRSGNFTAAKAAQTHCVNGHEFTPENTYTRALRNGHPGRMCRACNRDRKRASRASRAIRNNRRTA